VKPKYKWILLDGRHLLWRVTMKLASLSVELPGGDRVPTGGIYGFINVATKVVQEWADRDGCTLVICWEGCGASSGYGHRTDMYPDYKGNRKASAVPDDIRAYLDTMDSQQKILKQMLQIVGWNQAWCPRYEGDDIMATLAHKLEAAGETDIMIYTADHDLHQMVTDQVTCVSPPPTSGKNRKEKVYNTAAVIEKHGVPPELIPDLKGLGGDTGDNIPGVPGIGPGWAAKMLDTYGCHEEVVLTAESGETLAGEYKGKKWQSPAKSKAVAAHAEQARLSYQLAITVTDVPVRFLRRRVDLVMFRKAIMRFKMKSLIVPNTWADIVDIGARTFPPHISL
jgi:DNA polymerase-1